ncbi:MAG: DUF3078 domain-containing protein [Bacteroidales bacterium]|nr:DUF3078 domain-containing protein [Bacteroidales bacterium]
MFNSFKTNLRLPLILSVFLAVVYSAYGQTGTETETDSLRIKTDTLRPVVDSRDQDLSADTIAISELYDAPDTIPDVKFNAREAIDYLTSWYRSDAWNDDDHPLRKSISRLLFEVTNDPFYVAEDYLRNYEWETIKIPARSFYLWDTLHIPIPRDDDKQRYQDSDIQIDDPLLADTLAAVSGRDTVYADSVLNERYGNVDYRELNNIYVRNNNGRDRDRRVSHDSIILVISDTLEKVISSNPDFPFLYYDHPGTGDSIQMAIKRVTEYIADNDSSRVMFTGSDNTIPVWMSNTSSRMTRLWLRNEWDEEISVWIGSTSRDSIDLLVERGVHFRRPDKRTNIADAKIEIKSVDKSSLAEARKAEVKPQYWKFLSEASFVFNQAMIKNWVKGGESNVSTLLDITGNANYTNKDAKTVWNNQARLKFGLITASTPQSMQVRKNVDELDLISKFNSKAFGKFDFSATMLFKTQLAFGYKYPNDSVVVSKFFNPASLTLGLGLDYKPNKNTSINFAPLSYKATFVPDTAMIDPTNHGLKADQRSRHEPGMSAQINHEMTVFNDIKVVNKLRLFTNYIDDPLNIDIDWEMIATAKLNWFTDIRLNTHLIYDDDTLIPVKDENDEQVNNADGSPKKVPMVQFKEMIGLSVIFRF